MTPTSEVSQGTQTIMMLDANVEFKFNLFISHRQRELQPYMYALFKIIYWDGKQKGEAYRAVSQKEQNKQ